ncbi:MAG: ATPase [Planctomycetes bacterium]|nr:ATPase [Planctomycetota bacterium]
MTGRAKHPGQKKDRPRGVTSRSPGVHARGAKAAGALVCGDCGVVQHRGKWNWGAPPLVQLSKGRCPACQRVRERYPAGTLRLPAHFLAHRQEVLQLIRNVEATEKLEHPLERLMAVEDSDGCLVVTTTGVHLARRIAHKLAKRFHAKPRIRYADDEELVHVDWAPAPVTTRRRGAGGAR